MDQNVLLAQLKSEAVNIDKVIDADLKSASNPQLREILEYSLLGGGKRVRPLLTIMAARLCRKEKTPLTGQAKSDLYKLAIAFEYLHAASLLHDDVIDHADLRRGRAAANSLWGSTPAILAGDYLHSRAIYLAGTIGGKEVLKLISNAASAMVESEFIQMQTVANRDQSEENYFNVLRGKTAALIAAACETGALYAEAKEEEKDALKSFGSSIGLAFQIVDDLLDYLGDANKTGKIVGNDFVEGKMTLPLIAALSRCHDKERAFLDEMLESPSSIRKSGLAKAHEIIEKHSGFSYSLEKAETLIREASSGLDIFADCPEKEVLIGLGQYVLKRNK